MHEICVGIFQEIWLPTWCLWCQLYFKVSPKLTAPLHWNKLSNCTKQAMVTEMGLFGRRTSSIHKILLEIIFKTQPFTITNCEKLSFSKLPCCERERNFDRFAAQYPSKHLFRISTSEWLMRLLKVETDTLVTMEILKLRLMNNILYTVSNHDNIWFGLTTWPLILVNGFQKYCSTQLCTIFIRFKFIYNH